MVCTEILNLNQNHGFILFLFAQFKMGRNYIPTCGYVFPNYANLVGKFVFSGKVSLNIF